MSPLELRASLSLASIFALRMLGLFLILPVFAVHARHMPGGESSALVGLAIGIYGLTQGLLQIPFGVASDRLGRKPVIIAGLLLFGAGSFLAAGADTLSGVIIGRALQGAGAISAAVTAMIADATRDENRTKAMAMVGGSIGLTFALSLVVSPVLYAHIGLSGLFTLTGLLCIAAIGVVCWVVPAIPLPVREPGHQTPWRAVLLNPELLRLNGGIFTLHVVQMAMFVVVPVLLVEQAGMALPEHWKIYLPVVLGSFVIMVPLLLAGEKRGHLKTLFLFSIALLIAVQALFAWLPAHLSVVTLLLLAFFVGFNILEASLPSLVSKVAPASAKGAALGVYNTTQALGLFVGGALGGWVASRWGALAVFETCAVLLLLWLVLAWPMRVPVKKQPAEAG
ncbi:MAG: MFS transporter [Burkholderiales bacterium]|jgi:MFS family permease|nr:MFS transporter [Burkholderiales bacterium]MCA3156660.1 MFS transporter [Burkholderiales bacterium]MCA3169008.1 MFS transporter [Burkholderiales bacterium]